MFDRSGNPAGMPGIPAPSGPRTRGGVGPRFLPFLPLAFADFRVADFRPSPGIPMLPTTEAIILRASKNRSTRLLPSDTVTPDPLAMRRRREALMIFGSAR